ncbi:hypothetical protein LIER_23535 [Lithospermum erythrorhizon]|uniref:Uncharacterized protein n=1 Tax=Lithospermum erythrorhizon TaxID=34254 RepID=A0AAV3R1C8_LITER
MILYLPALDEHVIHVDLHIPSDLGGEYLVDHPLVCGPCILQAKGHHFPAVDAILSYEYSLFYFFLHHEYPQKASKKSTTLYPTLGPLADQC